MPNGLAPATYRVTLQLTIDGVDTEQNLTLEESPPDGLWQISGTDLRLRAPGCWKRTGDPIVSLSLRSCQSHAAIKLVVAKPAGEIGIEQYVTNSVEVYSRNKMWRVLERSSETCNVDPAVSLRLELAISGSKQTLAKLFVLHDGHFLVLTYYPDGVQSTPIWSELSRWLVAYK